MKKFILSLLLLFSLVLCVSCGEEEASTITFTPSTTIMSDTYINRDVTLPSVTVNDSITGDVTSQMTVKVTAPSGEYVQVQNGKFKTTETGEYVVVFSATNNKGEVKTYSFKFKSLPIPNPTITFTDSLKPVYVGSSVTVPSVKATDIEDGDISSSVTYVVNNPNGAPVEVVSGAFVCEFVGAYVINYSVTASSGKTGKFELTQEVLELPVPVITVSKSSIPDTVIGATVEIPTCTATDAIDGNITAKVLVSVKNPSGLDEAVVDNKFTASIEGTYTITYSVTNSSSKVCEKTIEVKVRDAEKPDLRADVESMSDQYNGLEITLPVVTCIDLSDPELKATLTITYPDQSSSNYTESTLKLNSPGLYKLVYSATNKAGKSASLTFEFNSKNFLVGWDYRMYTAGISGMTKTIANQYKAFAESKLVGTEYEGVQVEMVPFDQAKYEDLVPAMLSSGVELIVGFTSTTFNPVTVEETTYTVEKVNANYGKIAGATNRCFAQLSNSPLAELLYKESIKSEGYQSVAVKQIVVGWFTHTATTATNKAAVEKELEAYFTSIGEEIDVITKEFAKTTYQETHDAIVEAEVVLGFNWGSNFNLASGFLFTSARMAKEITFSGTANRYVASMVKQNTIYEFYNNLFDYCKTNENMLKAYTE